MAIAAGKQADASRIIAEKAAEQAKATNDLAAQAQRSADTESKQLAVMQAQFETSYRPWISITSIEATDIEFRVDPPSSLLSPPRTLFGTQVKLKYKNVGNLPAIGVRVSADMFFADWEASKSGFPGSSPSDEAQRRVKDLCANEGSTYLPGFMMPNLAPGREEEFNPSRGGYIDKPGEILPDGRVSPILFGCIFYRFSSSTVVHHCGFIFYVGQKTQAVDFDYIHIGVAPALSDERFQDVSGIAFSD